MRLDNEIRDDLKKIEVVSMAEKVKFWEEQDRINKAIIPWILKNYDLIVELNSQSQNTTNLIFELKEKNVVSRKC